MKIEIESQISVDHREGIVIWRMAPDVAAFYAKELRRLPGNDTGIRSDADALNEAASRLDEAT